ncbi:5369_t:CDS:2 [Entrophospora sp. SA101]|nr:5369_t:CDS:2 [Entrophospora sp. SA101]
MDKISVNIHDINVLRIYNPDPSSIWLGVIFQADYSEIITKITIKTEDEKDSKQAGESIVYSEKFYSLVDDDIEGLGEWIHSPDDDLTPVTEDDMDEILFI